MKFGVPAPKASGENSVVVGLCLDCVGKEMGDVAGLTLDLGSTTTQTYQHARVGLRNCTDSSIVLAYMLASV